MDFARQLIAGPERSKLGLFELLPPRIESLTDQSERTYKAFCVLETNLEKHVNLRALQVNNETLFYRLIHDHLPEMIPIIYTHRWWVLEHLLVNH